MATTILNSGVMQVTSTGTAATLEALMNTASAGKGTAAREQKVNYVILNPEATIRVCLDGQTPTASVGLELLDLNVYHFHGATLNNIKLINAGVVNIQVGRDDTI